jgi:hypothetical protein
MRAFEKKARRLLRLVDRVAFAFLVGFRHGAPSWCGGLCSNWQTYASSPTRKARAGTEKPGAA